MAINKQGQAIFNDFQEIENTQVSIKKIDDDNQELDAYELYEY